MDTNPRFLDADVCYRALLSRDRRFDGVFFTAVTTTGVYCRPICPARTPGRDRCRFYTHAAVAERDGFRACFRCRPELAPGSANVDASARLCARVLALLDDDAALAALPDELGISSRHLRRVVQAELGVRPVALVQSRRLALAKQLVRDTTLPMTEVALASGFGSVRRFNSAFSSLFARSPSQFRAAKRATSHGDELSLQLHFRPPYDWQAMLGFLALRAVPGVELVDGDRYLRTVELGKHRGYLAVEPAGADSARVTVSTSLLPELPSVVARVRRLFDLDAHPDRVATALGALPSLGRLVKARPGLRLPGSWSGGEILIRAILGQQISVVAARTLAARLVERVGTAIETPIAGLSVLFPRPAQLSAVALSGLGILPSRVRTLLAAAPLADQLRPGADPVALAARLETVPGIGPWTAQYILLRALSWPDAWPTRDIALLQALRMLDSDENELERVRPYRGYAAIHLWTHLGDAKPQPRKARR